VPSRTPDATRGVPPRRATAEFWPALAAVAIVAFLCTAYFPGALSFDAAYQWWQARSGETSDIQAPGLMLLFRLVEPVWPGPAMPFLIHLTLFAAGLWLIAGAATRRRLPAMALVLVTGLAPMSVALLGHVWSDVGLLAALVFTAGALLRHARDGGRGWLIAAAFAAAYAALCRHNAAPALLPLALYATWIHARRAGRARFVPLGLAVFAVLTAGAGLATRLLAREHYSALPGLALWDLAAISVETRELVMPLDTIGPGLSVEELDVAYVPWANVPLFERTRSGVRNPYAVPWPEADIVALRRAWAGAVIAHPGAWLRHRLRVTAALLGNRDPAWPEMLSFVDAETGYRDNPPVELNHGAVHGAVMAILRDWRCGPLLAPWPYLLIGLLALPVAWHRCRSPVGALALTLIASAFLYAAPLPVIAPSAELRYLGWSCVACLLGAGLALTVKAEPAAPRYATPRPLP